MHSISTHLHICQVSGPYHWHVNLFSLEQNCIAEAGKGGPWVGSQALTYAASTSLDSKPRAPPRARGGDGCQPFKCSNGGGGGGQC